MSFRFYPLTVSEIIKETEDCVSVYLEIPDDLIEKFRFIPGQYLTFKHIHDGNEIRRSYSISSSFKDKELRVAVKKIANGIFSGYVNDKLKPGDKLDVAPPAGNFSLSKNKSHNGNYVFFAAGSGITPIICIIKDILCNEPQSNVTLFYGNKRFDDIIYREELEGLKNLHLNRFALYYIFSKEKLGSPLFFGRMNGDKCEKFSTSLFSLTETDCFLLCGPAEMIFSIRGKLTESGVEESKIRYELFSTAGINTKTEKEKSQSVDFNPEESAKVILKLDDDVFEFDLKYGAESILEAALRQGADLPYACKGGVCSTCKARIVDGEVDMEVNYALEPDELATGYVLTCQSHPRSSRIVVDFDQK